MIFAGEGHIEMIRNGLYGGQKPPFQVLPAYPFKIILEKAIKTQTRRVNRGIYQVGRDYAVQRKRGVRAEVDIRIVIGRIWKEERTTSNSILYVVESQAWAEGGYTPGEFETLFRELNPKWDGWCRWAFEFHVVEVRR